MYKVLDKIKSIDDDKKLKEYIRKRIYWLTKKVKDYNMNFDTIGAFIGINSYEAGLDYENKDKSLDAWVNFIPKGQRIVYNVCHDEICRLYNRGGYYYLDDFTYLYDFVRYIKNKEINNIGNLVEYVYIFICDYFEKLINPVDRDRLFQLILENEKSYFKPIKEHSIKDFYHNGAALCSEYSAVAQNILAFMNIDTLYLLNTNHVYNIIGFEGKNYLVDFSLPVSVFDIHLQFIKALPFFLEIEGCDEAMLQSIVDRKNALVVDCFNYIDINGTLIEYYYNNRTRRYACGGKLIEDEENKIILSEDEIDKNRKLLLIDEEEKKDKENGIVLTLK